MFNGTRSITILIVTILIQLQLVGASGTLIVNLSPFNYSDGVNSDEWRNFYQRQGEDLGQPHVTFEIAGRATCKLVIIPATTRAVRKLKARIEDVIGINEFLRKNLGNENPPYPYTSVIDFELMTTPWRDCLNDTNLRIAVVSLNPGTNTLTGLTSGRYFILPIVRFSGRGIFSSYYIWSASFYRSLVTVEYEDFYGQRRTCTLYPIVWSPNEITITDGSVSVISVKPHAYNLSFQTGVKKFFKEVVFGEFAGIGFPED